ADGQSGLAAGALDANLPDSANTIGIVADEVGSTSLQITSELAGIAGGDVRLVPIVGLGSLQNLNDLFNLKGIDAAIVQTDVLDYARKQKIHSDIDKKLRFIARLHNREVHLIARSDQPDIASLRGRRVNVGPAGSGTAITAAAIFEAAGLQITATTFEHGEALHLIKTGQIDAMVYVGGKPVPFLQNLDPADGLKLLSVPFMTSLQKHYRPGDFQHREYRGLLPADKSIETVSVGTAIVAFNWPQRSKGYSRLERFTETLFGSIAELRKKPRHDKWRAVNLAAALPGWQRHGAAQGSVLQAQGASGGGDEQIDRLRATFKAVLHSLPVAEAVDQ
ncbi:MAG: TAXI family TRAP transporter solute-binding subunit, partial [Aestuariivirgaceae bacterium]